jgi:hypothetical protein
MTAIKRNLITVAGTLRHRLVLNHEESLILIWWRRGGERIE